MKKLYLVILSLMAGLATVLYLNELVKSLVASLVTGGKIELVFNGIILTAVIPFTHSTTAGSYGFLLAVPLILSIIFVEASSVILKKTNNLNLRQGLVIFQLINIGYLVVNVFIGILSVLIKNSFDTAWTRLFEYAGFSYTRELVLMLLILILLFAYINYSANRLRKYITIIKEK